MRLGSGQHLRLRHLVLAMKRALLLLLLAGCMEAQAGPSHGPGVGPRMLPKRNGSGGGGGADAGFDVFASYGTWTFELNGSGAPDPSSPSSGWQHSISGTDAGALAWSQGADAGTYTVNQSTGSLTSDGLGAAFVDEAVVVNGSSSCWTLSTSLLPAITDGEDVWCRIVFATGDNTTTRFLFSFGNAATDLFSNGQISTERNLWGMRVGGGTILNAQSAVLATGTTSNYHFADVLYRGANPTSPSFDAFTDGTAVLGPEHSVNFGGLSAGQRITVGGTSAGQCTSTAIDNRFTIVRVACKIGTAAIGGVTVNEALHDADCTRLGVCP